MDEVKFVLKSLAATVAIVLFMQIQVGNESLETKAEFWLHTSSIPKYFQGVADGAIKASKTASRMVSDLVSGRSTSGNINSSSNETKASKWNIEFKHTRSQSKPTDPEDQE